METYILDLTLPVILIGGSTLAIAFYVAYSIGANDLANSMGTSVGSKALSIKKAIIIAGIFEFAGAVLVGTHVTTTLQKGIVNSNTAVFVSDPYLYLYGMLAALLAAAIWISISTYFSLPISTSQSIVGAIIGFGIIAAGASSISWGKLIEIGESWVLSPIIGAVLSFFIFLIIKKIVLDTKKLLIRQKNHFIFYICFICCYFIFYF